jgi:cobalt-zinc-cadmium efflux system outer membrane protein
MRSRNRGSMRWALSSALLALSLGADLAAQQPSAAALTLDQAISEALANNLSLMAERANIALAEAGILTAGLRPNPVLSFGGDHLDLMGTGFNEINGAGPPEYNLRTDFLFERGAKRQIRVEVAQNARSVAQSQFLDSVRTTILDVQNAFLDVLLAKANLTLSQENLDSLNRIAETNEVRVRAGDLSEAELIRSRLAALQYENSVQRANLALRSALTRLQILLGRPRPSPSFDVTGEFRRDATTPSLAELCAIAQKSRPDLKALYLGDRRAAADLRLQIAQGKVDYSLGTEYRRQQGINGKSNSLGFFLSVPLPLFNRNQGEIERARQEQRQIQLRIRALEASIVSELENAYEQFKTARLLLDNIESRMLSPARDVREITEFSYKRGSATLLELLDAERAFNETMQAHNEARAEYARSQYLLDAVSGRSVAK